MSTPILVLIALMIAVLLFRRLVEERIACNSCLRAVRKRHVTSLADGRLICKQCLNNGVAKVERVVADRTGVAGLAYRIGHASLKDAEVLKTSIHAKDEKDETLRWFAIVSEFLYFYMHLANRFAYQEFGHEKRCKLQDELYPLIIRPTIDSVLGHWPAELKDKIEAEFIENLGRAEIEYGACKQLLDRENPLAEDALFSKFAGNVCSLIRVEKTDKSEYAECFMTVLEVATDSFKRLNFVELRGLVSV